MHVSEGSWEAVARRLKIIFLDWPVQLAVPSLILPAIPRSTRGFSFHPGRFGVATGVVLLGASSAMAWLLWMPLGAFGAFLPLWLFGTAGTLMVANGVRPLAFVKPICTKCRLLPVIAEHEAVHLTGVGSEKAVWASMQHRHSRETLKLDGDPAICWFCPIPKRLAEH
jgi:hypothetical protein